MPRLVRTEGLMKALEAPEGTLIWVRQGFTIDYREILPSDDPRTNTGAECFRVLQKFEKPTWGSGVFRVRADGTLHHLESNYDTSD